MALGSQAQRRLESTFCLIKTLIGTGMHTIFQHKKILILASGSIALYKMLDCISMLQKYGACVKVAMSKEAERFVSALSFEALSHNLVLCEDSQSWNTGGANHISYAKWADVVLVAPATANTIAKIAQGVADNVLLSTLLATKAPKLLAPAMNTQMLYAPQTQENLSTLQNLGYEIIPPRSSLLVCGDSGEGALESIEEIIFRIAQVLGKDEFWEKQSVIISGGGSRESIDDVRYISNHSSGKQASQLAIALYMRGAKVSFVSSLFPLVLPKAIKCVSVASVSEFANAIHAEIDMQSGIKPIVFMTAALADFTPKSPVRGKMKKEQIGREYTLECVQTEDILCSIDPSKAYKVAFKAEVDSARAYAYAEKILQSKGCEMVCLNVISEDNPFGGDQNLMSLISQRESKTLFKASKFDISLGIADFYKHISQGDRAQNTHE